MPSLRARIAQWVSPAAPANNQESFGVADGSVAASGYGDTALMIDNFGWQPLGMNESLVGNDLRPYDRMMFVRRARVYYERDAYSRQAIRLNTIYCIGRGLSIKARDYKATDAAKVAPDGTPQLNPATVALQEEADAFWEHPDNSYVFSAEAQSINSDKLNVDGELFFALFPPDGEDDASDGVTRVRTINDCLQIKRIIKNPEDDSEPWFYLRVWSQGAEIKKCLYPDWRLFLRERDDDGMVTLPDVPDLFNDLAGIEVNTRAYMYHMKVNTIGERGNSLLTPALDWAKVMRTYLEDRATINRAHARFAWKRIVKGPASAVAAFGRKLASTTGATGVPIPAPAGSTLNVNQGVDWEQMGAQDGGKNAYSESRNFRLMFCAAVGFAEHYFADGSMGTRATSKEMERPTELMLSAYQTIWKSGYESMFAFHLVATGHEYDAHAVWVDAPQILEDDTASIITSILSVIGVLPQFDIDEMIIRMLNSFAIDDPQDVLIKIRQRQAELFQQNLELVYAQAGLDPTTLGDMSSSDPAVMKFIQAQSKVITMLTAPSDPTREPGPKIGPQFADPGTKGGVLKMRKPTPPKMRPADPVA